MISNTTEHFIYKSNKYFPIITKAVYALIDIMSYRKYMYIGSVINQIFTRGYLLIGIDSFLIVK